MDKKTFAEKLSNIVDYRLCCRKNFFLDSILSDLKKDPTLIDAQSKYGNTLLHHMAKFTTRMKIHSQLGIEEFGLDDILPFKPNPFVKNIYGHTPRMVAEASAANQQFACQLAAYEMSYQSDCLASAIEAQSTILQHQVMEKINQPSTEKDAVLSERMTYSPYYRQPQEVLKARNQLQVIVKNLRGTPNERV